MHLEEKIDRIKNKLSSDDLVIRYTEFKSIMGKIEKYFLSNDNPNYKYNGWIERLVKFEEETYSETTFDYLRNRLNEKEKYWWIYVESPSYPNSRHRVFDATIIGGESLASVFSDSPIFIIHKKYHWMIMLDSSKKIIKERYKTVGVHLSTPSS